MSTVESTAAVNIPVDASVREEALDPSRSFIVQAPAGSGKTELLTRRVLTLLTLVDEPEEVLSITFTRKAASEMRARVVETLQAAASGVEPDNAYQLEGFKLAQAVLARDKKHDWQLLQNTQRLNLRTIDALCTTLAHRLPVVSALGGPAGLADDPRQLYRLAAERLLDERADELDLLLLQLGNRHEYVQGMLAELLGNRDQWSGYVLTGLPHDKLREILESKLQQLIESRLQELVACLPTATIDRLVELLSKVGPTFKILQTEAGKDTRQAEALMAITSSPGSTVNDLPAWIAIANALLTAASPGSLRKPGGITKASGFPVAAKDAELVGVPVAELKVRKEQMVGLVEELSDDAELVELLNEVRGLPPGRYTEKDWALLSQLLSMLPELLLELQSVFAERGEVDFVEMTLRAQRALGSADAPTDLALALDMRIKHVLVDEFQDTSRTQFALYSMLVAGWQPDDGRTFFAVGDPMQSIYRFREGDVTLFAHARDHGVGSVQLEPLRLTVNFRAAPAVVDWVNHSFVDIFPKHGDDVTGAVPYAESVAHLQTEGRVELHPFVDSDIETEANHVALLIEHALQEAPIDDAGKPKTSIAILLRSRPQAGPVFKALQARGIAYQAVDIELLGDRHVVRDLLSLTLALRYPHDRLHWLSILRAPWCGLTLGDLHVLMDDAAQATVFDLLNDTDRIARMSKDGQARVEKCLPILTPAVQRSSRGALMPWVEACWQQLGGPVVCTDRVDLDAAERCITQLRSLEQTGRLWQSSVLHSSMENLFAAAADGDAQVQVMTLHKSKGLEFDTVILPALDRMPRRDTSKVLNWFESGSDADERLLLAPISERGLDKKKSDPINNLVRRAGQLCDEQEKLRLLYVACTRAKKTLHLLARAKTNKEGELRSPEKTSLLTPLWPLFENQIGHSANKATANGDAENANQDVGDDEAVIATAPLLQQLPVDWTQPVLDVFAWPAETVREPSKEQSVEFLWAGTLARDVGTAVHDQLQLLSQQKVAAREELLADMPRRVKLQLQNSGVPQGLLDAAVSKVINAIDITLSDDRGCWVLSDEHEEARSEWAISAPIDGVVKRIVIDRTFVDEAGVRWIIDYKTGDHAGSDKDAFLDAEQERYTDQLQRYADIIGRMESRSVKAALYFPLLKGWREIDVQGEVPKDAPTESSTPHQAELF